MTSSIFQRWALYLFFFSINFEVWDPFNTGGFFSISKLTGFIYLLSILPDIGSYLELKEIKQPVYTIWIFFVLLTVISYININYTNSAFFDFTLFQNIFLFLFLINHERIEPDILEKGMLSFAIGSIILALLYYFGVGIETTAGRVSIFGDNANIVGIRMCISSVVILILIIQNKLNISKWRFLFFILIPVMLLLLAETGSRVAFISFALSFLVGVFLMNIRMPRLKLVFLLFSIVVGFYVWDFFMQSVVLNQRLLQTVYEGNLAGRDYIWGMVVSLIKENLIFGVGQSGYALNSQIVLGKILSPHNVLLEIMAYSGIIGLLIFLIFLLSLVKISFRYFSESNYLLPIILFIPIAGLLLSGQLLGVKIGWIIFAYACSKVFYLNSSIDLLFNLESYENTLRNR